MITILQNQFNSFLENYKTNDLTKTDKEDLISSVAQLALIGLDKNKDFNALITNYYIKLLNDDCTYNNCDKILRGLKFFIANGIKFDNIEIAKMFARKNAKAASNYIGNFVLNPKNPKDREALIEIAKICAAQSGAATSACIKNYGLDPKENREALIEIAKICAAQAGGDTAYYIKNFGFDPQNPEDRKDLIEIAKICIAQDGKEASEYIENFGFDPQNPEDRKDLIEIAKICVAQDGKETSEYIKNFGLDPKNPEEREALIEIAKICAAQDGEKISRLINNYGFDPKNSKEREGLIEIAKISAAQNVQGTSSYIENYGLNSQTPESRKALIEIAKICAAQDGRAASGNIKHFGLDPKNPEEREALIEIAKICATQDARWTSQIIKDFGLNPKNSKEREGLIEIAKICAAQDGRATSEHIKKFKLDHKNLENQIALAEIFKIALDQNFFGSFLFRTCYNLDFKSDKLLFISKEIFNQFFLECVNYQEFGGLNPLLKDSYLQSYSQQRYDFLMAYLDSDLSKMENFLNQAISAKESLKQLLNFEGLGERNKIKAMALIAYTLFKFEGIDEAAFKTSLPVIKDILRIQQPRLRYDLINRLHSVLLDPEKKQSFFAMYVQAKSTFKLPLLYCALIEIDNATTATVNRCLNLNHFKKDGNLKRLTLETLDKLSQLPDLTLSDKSWLMGEAFKGNLRQVKSILQLIRTHILVARGNGLNRESLERLDEADLQQKLKKQFANELKKLIPVSSENEGLYEKYLAVTQQFRDPTMLLQYMQGTVKKVTEQGLHSLEKTFVQFLDALLAGNFQEWRYSKESNPHLRALFQENAIEEAWKTGLVDEIGAEGDSTSQLDFKDLIRRSFGDHHFDKSQFPELVKYLEKPDAGTSDKLKERVNKEAQKKPSTDEIKQEIKRLSFTLKAIELMETTDSLRNKNILENLIKLNIAENQFADDLKDWKAMLEQSHSKTTGEILKVVEGDDPYDLLVCGTEVLGSCQSVYGSPYKNMCLLGYIANGQNRLIAVKDSGGKIIARALIRLLSREGKPVLFLERLYPANITKNQRGAIFAMAEKKARVMGLPLFELGPETTGAQIQSLGGQAPYDYVDASVGVAPAGKYAIWRYSAVWQPIQEMASPVSS